VLQSDRRLACDNLTVSVNGRTLVSGLSVELAAGNFVCVLGTNGAGKTLTLHTLAGLRAPQAGHVFINGSRLDQLPRKAIARQLGLLLQLHDDAFPMTVMDTVLMGRYPHAGLWNWSDKQAHELARNALNLLDLQGIENRIVTSLSGGERERVALATIMVQNPAIMLLDEPTNHLDPHHQLIVLDVLQNLARQGRIVATTVHNPALAMRYADFVLLLYGDGDWEYGPASELLEPERLQRMYKTPFDYFHDSNGRKSVLLPV
jgi:iron complex transport system ATP-binding protein